MTSQPGNDSDALRLSEDAAANLLARASQLDAASFNHMSVAELRQAARNAGIAPEAFEQALSEFQAASAVATAEPRKKPRWGTRIAIATFLILATLVFLSRLFVVGSGPHVT